MTPIDIRQMSRIIFQMSSRAIQERYRGSILGVLWTILTPIFMLAVYTFIFTKVFTVRWGQDVSDVGTLQFSALLFVGLSLYSFLNEVIPLHMEIEFALPFANAAITQPLNLA